MRNLIQIVEGIEEMGGTTVSLNPSPSQIIGLCSRLSQYQILRGWFFITKTDQRVQVLVWGAEKKVHNDIAHAMMKSGIDIAAGTAVIIGLDINSIMKSCDWEDWDAYQSGDLFYVRDEYGEHPVSDDAFEHYFPSSQPLDVKYNDDSEWEIVENLTEVDQIKPLSAAKYGFWNTRYADQYLREQDRLTMVEKIGDVELLTIRWPLTNSLSVFFFRHDHNIIGYADMVMPIMNNPTLQSIGIIYLDAPYRKKGFGYAFYSFLLNNGYSLRADQEHTPASRKLWEKLCLEFDVRLGDHQGVPYGDRLTTTALAYDDEGTHLVARKVP